jgi:hypothetical protein
MTTFYENIKKDLQWGIISIIKFGESERDLAYTAYNALAIDCISAPTPFFGFLLISSGQGNVVLQTDVCLRKATKKVVPPVSCCGF